MTNFLKRENTLCRRKTNWFASRHTAPTTVLAITHSPTDHVGHPHHTSWKNRTCAVWACWGLVCASTTAVSGL